MIIFIAVVVDVNLTLYDCVICVRDTRSARKND